MVGPLTEERITQHRVDKAIIGVSGILLEEGFFAAMPQETEIKRLMIASALKAIVVADSSKIGTRALSLITAFNRKITLITDNGITRIARSSLEASGIEVIVV
jgi:DeoR/GlpR family transcriptional regulator of sugar metabolism